MPKYFMLWELDTARVPLDPKERGAAWTAMLTMIKQDMKEGKITDWGSYAPDKGYTVTTVTDMEMAASLQRFFPYVKYQVFQAMTVDQVAEVAKSMMQ